MIVGPCTVLTGGDQPAVLEEAAVRIVGAHIAQVGPAGHLAAAYPDETLWPARGRVLMPGLVNTHVHLARHIARGLNLRAPAEWQRFDRALAAEDVYWSVMAGLVEGVRHGVTTVCDFHRSGACLDLSPRAPSARGWRPATARPRATARSSAAPRSKRAWASRPRSTAAAKASCAG